jgi:molybdopterin converting factor small subunit
LKHIEMIKVLFFGITHDISGTHEKGYSSESMYELCGLLCNDYPALSECRFRIAVNGVIVTEDMKLRGDEEVALLPPFAGG